MKTATSASNKLATIPVSSEQSGDSQKASSKAGDVLQIADDIVNIEGEAKVSSLQQPSLFTAGKEHQKKLAQPGSTKSAVQRGDGMIAIG